MKAIVGLIDDEPVAVAGIAFQGGKVFAFCNLDERAKRFPVLMHKTALKILNDASDAGHRYIFATVGSEPTARTWLRRLGFEPVDGDETVMLWQKQR